MSRKQYSKSDIKAFLEAHPFAESLMTKKSNVAEDDNMLIVDNNAIFFKTKDNIWAPTLKTVLQGADILPKVTVDKGAVKFVANGADIMRPGITKADDFAANDLVIIVEETYGKPLAVGQATVSSEELMKATTGKLIKTLHFVGDAIWNKN